MHGPNGDMIPGFNSHLTPLGDAGCINISQGNIPAGGFHSESSPSSEVGATIDVFPSDASLGTQGNPSAIVSLGG